MKFQNICLVLVVIGASIGNKLKKEKDSQEKMTQTDPKAISDQPEKLLDNHHLQKHIITEIGNNGILSQADCPAGTHFTKIWPKIDFWFGFIAVVKPWDSLKTCDPNDQFCRIYDKKNASCDQCDFYATWKRIKKIGNYCYMEQYMYFLAGLALFVVIMFTMSFLLIVVCQVLHQIEIGKAKKICCIGQCGGEDSSNSRTESSGDLELNIANYQISERTNEARGDDRSEQTIQVERQGCG